MVSHWYSFLLTIASPPVRRPTADRRTHQLDDTTETLLDISAVNRLIQLDNISDKNAQRRRNVDTNSIITLSQ